MDIETDRAFQIERDRAGARYYRNAVERHWDPTDIDLGIDVKNLTDALRDVDPETHVDMIRTSLARFGAGEQAVTEDLAPLAVALDDIEDQLFVTTQLYEEAKHTDFFDRYWREVIHEAESTFDLDRSSPTDSRWFNESYIELFERNEKAMDRLLEDDSPETFARAYAHYHLVIEGILAQTGYYGLQKSYSIEHHPELPYLPGLYEGFTLIRQDEGRHVGFGMMKLKDLVSSGEVDPPVLEETVRELMPLVSGIVADENDPYLDDVGVSDAELYEFSAEKHTQRMKQITDAAAEVPDLEELTRLDGVDDES